jgi:hypothetical protein
LLNYQPVMTTQEGIDEFIQWYKKQWELDFSKVAIALHIAKL